MIAQSALIRSRPSGSIAFECILLISFEFQSIRTHYRSFLSDQSGSSWWRDALIFNRLLWREGSETFEEVSQSVHGPMSVLYHAVTLLIFAVMTLAESGFWLRHVVSPENTLRRAVFAVWPFRSMSVRQTTRWMSVKDRNVREARWGIPRAECLRFSMRAWFRLALA